MDNMITTDEFLDDLTGKSKVSARSGNETREKRGVAPTLVVGLGGTGVEVVGRLKRRLRTHYRSHEKPADMIKFLLFDTVAITKQHDPDASQIFSESDEEYVNLSTNFNAYAYLQQNYAKDKDLREWWDNRYSVSPQYQEWGAKRVRQLGRLFLHHKHLQVESIIQKKVSDTCTLYEELVRGQNLADVGSNFRIYIITSSCGGTGSGIFLDVLYKIWRAVLAQGRIPEIRAFMFLPGVFEQEVRKSSLELVQAHRANAYAFLKELDYFLSPQSDISRFILDANTRDPSQVVAIPPGSLIKYSYLIDRQLGNLGNLDKPEDAYNLVADAMYQMIVTPVGQDEEGVGLTNIDSIVDPTHLREGKRTAYSSLGLSRILFPRSTLQAQLTYSFLRDIIFQGLTASYPWMDEAAGNDERVKGLVSKLEEANFSMIDDFSRPVLNLVSQCPGQSDMQNTELDLRIDKVTKEKDLNDNRVADGMLTIDERYRQFEKEAKNEAKNAVINMVNNCEYGVFYAQKVLLLVKKGLRNSLEDVRRQRHEYEDLKIANEREFNGRLQDLEKIVSKRAVLFKSSQVNKISARMANFMRSFTDAALTAKVLEKKQVLLETLVGQEQLVEEHLAGEEIVIERKIQKSLLDQEIDQLGRVIDKLNRLGDRAEEKAKDGQLAEDDVGATITTQMFPSHVKDFLKSPALRSSYNRELNSATMHKHIKAVLGELNDSEEYRIEGIYQLSSAEREVVVKKLLISIVANYVGGLFKEILGQNVVEATVSGLDTDKFANQVMGNLFELSQPCWNYDLQKANDPGITELPRTYSLGYSDPESLPIPEGRHRPGLVRTKNNHQITLLQAQHGLPIFALRLLPTLRADYKKYMRLAEVSGSQPLHLHKDWTRDIEAAPDLKVPVTLNDRVLLDFALGMFSDYLIMNGDDAVGRLLKTRPTDKGAARGYIYTTNGRDYYALKLSDQKSWMQIEQVEHLASSGRADAAEAYANFPESAGTATKFTAYLAREKQYQLIVDLETYIEKMIIPEAKQVEDEEEKGVLEREYSILQNYLKELKYQQRRGLPMAG